MDKDADILELARARYALEKEMNSDLRVRQSEDVKFKHGDQWDAATKASRENDPFGARPCLVINHARTHANAVINDIRQNRPQIKVLPADDYADVETADMLNGLIRHIQVAGDADLAYDVAMDFMVTSGEGYFEVITKEVGEGDTFDEDGNPVMNQEPDIEPIINPHAVHMDPYCENPTGADAKWCFIDDPQSRDDLEKEHPDADLSDWSSAEADGSLGDWYLDEKRINAARYFYIEGEGEESVIHVLKLVGDAILERSVFPGQYLPIIRVAGEETIVDGKRDVKGLIRDIKDPCRMYNYWASAATERIALAPKAPIIGVAGAFEGHEKSWEMANTANIPYLEYNGYDDQNRPLPAPQRQAPIQQDTAIVQAMMQAHDDIKAVSGKYDASLGNRSNETSGVAIRNRDRQGDTLTFHFTDNLNRAIRQCGRVLVGLIPLLYNEDRIVRILGEDETPDFAQLSPNDQAFTETEDGAGGVSRIYDVGVGHYDVTVKAGPSYSTRRQESVEEMSALLARNPQAFQLIGHKMIKNMDWPGADEAAEILEAMLPPEVKAITDAKKQGGDQVRAQVEMAQKAILDQVEPAMDQLRQQAQQAGEAAQQAGQENAMLKIANAQKDLEKQKLENALADKSGELQIKAAEVQQKASSEQQGHEADIVIASMGQSDEPKEDNMANTVAAQAAMQAVEQMNALTKSLAEQTQSLTESARQSAELLSNVTEAHGQMSAEVIHLKERIEARDAKDAAVQSAVLGFMSSDGGDKALKKTITEIKKS
jgi:hypothetical protein